MCRCDGVSREEICRPEPFASLRCVWGGLSRGVLCCRQERYFGEAREVEALYGKRESGRAANLCKSPGDTIQKATCQTTKETQPLKHTISSDLTEPPKGELHLSRGNKNSLSKPKALEPLIRSTDVMQHILIAEVVAQRSPDTIELQIIWDIQRYKNKTVESTKGATTQTRANLHIL